MSRRSGPLANLLGGALFLVSVCLLLPIILLRHVTEVLAAWPAGPLG